LTNLLVETKYLFEKYNEVFLKEYYGDEELVKYRENKQKEYNQKQEQKTNEDSDSENKDNEMEDSDSENTENEEKDEQVDIQALSKLYKKLSLKTHPDKVPDKIDVFKKITTAYKKKDLITMIIIAHELQIDIINIIDINNDNVISLLNKNIENINKEIDQLQNTVAWHWSNASEEEKAAYKEKSKI
jgi:hypothetical protein